ncbi:hypothetical protein DYB32_005990 [Aphanomyces invadans]|uniref:DDE-1 domain-containing protein n=1 Tax=Aphanomyces invadans TaxID=157072 RepID=A0A418AT17_9STRA|nr:hypothetical protein DYB32_005990 [Aphanomyces invadans]
MPLCRQVLISNEYLPTKKLNPTKDYTVEEASLVSGDDDVEVNEKGYGSGQSHLAAGFGKRVRKEVKPLQARHGCRIYANPTAWWNSELSMAFLKYHFAERDGRDTKKVILLWDDFSAHFTDDAVAYAESINVILERVPLRFTCYPSRSTMVAWITGAWNVVPEAAILNGFRKCQLLDGAVVDQVDVVESALEENDIADLAANMAIEDTFDPAHDINDGDASELVML